VVAIALRTQAPFVIGPKTELANVLENILLRWASKRASARHQLNQDEHSARDCIPLLSPTFGKYALDGPPVNASNPIVPNFQMPNPAGTAAPPNAVWFARSVQKIVANRARQQPQGVPIFHVQFANLGVSFRSAWRGVAVARKLGIQLWIKSVECLP
jgi:hypothetical protein